MFAVAAVFVVEDVFAVADVFVVSGLKWCVCMGRHMGSCECIHGAGITVNTFRCFMGLPLLCGLRNATVSELPKGEGLL